MPRSRAREVPRWKRTKPPQQQPPQQVIQVRGRNARSLVRDISLQQQGQTGQAVNGAAPVNDALARTGAWRHRRSLPPFAFAAGLAVAALLLHSSPHPALFGTLAGLFAPLLLVKFTRHLSEFARRWCDFAALHAGIWLTVFGAAGSGAPVPLLTLLTWLPLAFTWVRHYRIAPGEVKEDEAVQADTSSDAAVWARLAAKRKWSAWLTSPQVIPGGVKYAIEMDGVETHVGNIMAEPRAVAAAYGKAQTEAYVEPDPSGIESKGVFTRLRAGTLQTSREWDGRGFDENGIARIGRFADSAPVRIRIFVPRDGTRHSLIAGTSGAGKSELLSLIVFLALTSAVPIVPVILDPQNGQSLPQWRGKVMYASGIDECAAMMKCLDDAMMDRSRRLASMTWDDDGCKVKGMPFYDWRLSGLPVVMTIMDEAPLLLSGDGNAKLGTYMTMLTAKAGKLERKTGGSRKVVAQVPSLAELGGDQALRSMLVGGNVIGLRTGDKVSGGMLGLQVDPCTLPKYFSDGSPTQGIGYAATMDNRQAPMRTDMVPSAMRHKAIAPARLEDEFLEAMNRTLDSVSPTSVIHPAAGHAPAPAADTADGDGPDGRRCTDAVLQVLADRGTEMERGEIIKWVGELATTGWGRPKPFSIKSVGDALRKLAEAGKIVRVRDGAYQTAGSRETVQ
jgi:hypothetical protein